MRCEDRDWLLGPVLKGVSRSFYLTLKVLPKNLREPFGVAYLLARTADTISDSGILTSQGALDALDKLRSRIEKMSCTDDWSEIIGASKHLSEESEQRLLMAIPRTLSVFDNLLEPDRNCISRVVSTLTRGMELDLTVFRTNSSDGIVAFEDVDQLDEYTYLVAGCVGEFWTDMMMAYNRGLSHWDSNEMANVAIRLGKGLQLTNVLRDVPKDLRVGRCYLPKTIIKDIGLTPEQLLNSSASVQARPALIWGIKIALSHYQASEAFIYSIPLRYLRLRLAVIWPLVMGLGTLEGLARNSNWLDPDHRSKLTRNWVYRMMALSVPYVYSNRLLKLWIHHLHKSVRRAL